ncbi:hypothetical protein MLD52_14290 [Puniceicoccaceae bacterium K14]|nr:hypothetical protein [Puniceicoccaceae bacterium K14]
MFKQISIPLAFGAIVGSFILWPMVVVGRAWRLTSRFGKRSGWSSGRKGRYFFCLVRIALRYRLNPIDIHRFELVGEGAGSNSFRDYVSEALVLPLLAKANECRETEILSDKEAFSVICQKRGIEAVSNLAIVGEGRSSLDLVLKGYRDSLIFKPRIGSRSEGVERWDWTAEGFSRAFQDTVLTAEALSDRVSLLSASREYLVQPCLRNHPELDDLSNGGVVVFRVLTVLVDGRVEVLAPIAQLPIEKAKDADWREVVVFVAVDIASGALTAILGRNQYILDTGKHPLSGAPIVGRVVPHWEEGMALVRKAHTAFPGLLVVGWDLVFTSCGPVLIEGNTGCALAAHQFPPQRPLRQTVLWDALLAKFK